MKYIIWRITNDSTAHGYPRLVREAARGAVLRVLGHPARRDRPLPEEPAAGLRPHRVARRLGVDVEVILTRPCIFCVENHE
jgi:hypothetical protein